MARPDAGRRPHWTRRAALVAALACCAAGPLVPASANSGLFYSCVDRGGHKRSGDQPPGECKDVDIDVFNPDGSWKYRIAAPETAAQRAERERRERELRESEDRVCSQRDTEKALLETYGSEEALQAARGRALAGKRLTIEHAQQKLAVLNHEKKRLDDEAEFYPKPRQLPDKLVRAFESNRVLREQQERAVAEAEQEMARIGAKYDGDLALFRRVEQDGPTRCVRTIERQRSAPAYNGPVP